MGDHQISAETQLMSDLDLQVLSDSLLTFDAGFDVNGQQLSKLGAGSVDFASRFFLNDGTLSAYASSDATVFFGSDAVLDGDYELLIAPGQVLDLGDSF